MIKIPKEKIKMKYRYIVVDCKKKISDYYKTKVEAYKAYNQHNNKMHLGILEHDVKRDLYTQIGKFGLNGDAII